MVQSQATIGMTIGKLAEAAGVGVETVRFYQRKGLLFDPKPSQIAGSKGRRHYGEDEARRLSFIRSAASASLISILSIKCRIGPRLPS